MTEDELDQAEVLWRRKVPVKEIARRLGYSEQGLQYNLRKNRDRFPPRRVNRIKDIESELGIWFDRILAGRATIHDVATKFGVSDESVKKRLRRYEARLDARERQQS